MTNGSKDTPVNGAKLSDVLIKQDEQVMAFDRPTMIKLNTAYNEALSKQETVFTFEGVELLTAYAKYLLEYLEERLV